MERLWDWLSGPSDRKRTFAEIARLFLWALAFYLFWMTLALLTAAQFGVPLEPQPRNVFALMKAVWVMPLLEEFLFRLLPVWVVRDHPNRSDWEVKLGVFRRLMTVEEERRALLIAGIVSCLVFTLVHGVLNIFVQGVFGVLAWIVFLYSSRTGKDLKRGYAACFILHATVNLVCFYNGI